MRKVIITLLLGMMLQSFCSAQIQRKQLRVYSITEYIDGYVIKAIDNSKPDTLNIVSVKETFKSKQGFKKMVVGEMYNFEYEDYSSKMAAMPIDNFVIRIKTTVVWRGSDAIRDRPVFGKNIKGLWLKKE